LGKKFALDKKTEVKKPEKLLKVQNMMKICLIAVNFFKHRGEGRVNYEIASEAIRRGHAVTLVARNVDAELAKSDRLSWVKLPSKGLPIHILSYTEFCYRVTQWLRKHRDEYDLVHVSEARLWTEADIFTSHFLFDTWLRSPFHPWQIKPTIYSFYHLIVGKWFAFWQNKLFPQAPSLIAVSETLRQELIAKGIAESKIHVINNGVELQEFYPDVANRSALGLPEDVTLALFVGDIKLPRKNLETLLQALKTVPDVHLAVVGDLQRSPYPNRAQQLGLSDRVHFLGFRRDVPEIMRAADFFVLPSRYDTFGLVVLEAMASGLPVIATKAMGVTALVTPASGIVLSDTEDVDALASAMTKLATNPTLRKQMGKEGAMIAQNHSWRDTARKYLDLFEQQSRSDESPIANQETSMLKVN
jgi:glycosyltransferase involved in cell wall biosynthesis